jgi:hypothetical protein
VWLLVCLPRYDVLMLLARCWCCCCCAAHSYSDVAIALNMLLARSPGGSLPTHQVLAPNDSMVTLPDASVSYGATVPLLDLLRAVTPLAWARWITAGGWGRVHKHGPATAAMYGSNAEWCVCCVSVCVWGGTRVCWLRELCVLLLLQARPVGGGAGAIQRLDRG